METAEKIRNWLLATAQQAGLSPRAWAQKAGLSPSTVQRAIKPEYPYVTSSRTLAKLAQAAGVDPPEIDSLTVGNGHVASETLPVRFLVGAGLWQSVEDVQSFYGAAPVAADPAFAQFPQWLERVIGDSMDLEYPEGTLVHVVDAISIGYAPQMRDHVIVERRRADRGEVERTVKEIVVTPSGVELHCRSSNPHWRGSVALTSSIDDEGCEIEVVGLVLGSYRPRR